jgi:hypothetical protein
LGKPKTEYDDDALVMAIARGDRSYGLIAADHGLSESTVARIARGRQRPELQQKIQAASAAMVDQVRRLGSLMAAEAMARLGRLVAEDSTAGEETQRKAAVDILKFAMGDPGRTEINVNAERGCDLAQLSDKTRQAILAELGGPTETP